MELNKRDAAFPGPAPVMEKFDAEAEMDRCYLQLIQLIHLLGSAFVAPHFWKRDKAVDDTFDQLVNIFADLAAMPGHDNGIFICETETSEKHPKNNVARYTLQFGNYLLNTEKAARVASRLKTSLTQLLRKLQIAFDIFSINGIHDLYLRLPEEMNGNLDNFRINLEIISLFDQAVKSGSDIVYQGKDQQIKIPIIKDQQGRADCNLTIFAALNHLSQNAMENINAKVTDYIEKQIVTFNPYGEYRIFNVLSHLKGLSKKMIWPLLEVNNVAFRLAEEESSVDPAVEAAFADSLIIKLEPDGPAKSASDSIQDPISPSAVDSEISEVENLAPVQRETDESPIIDLTDPVPDEEREEKTDSQQVGFNVSEEKSIGEEHFKASSREISGADREEIVDSTSFSVRLEEVTKLITSLKNAENGEKILDGIIENLQLRLKKDKDGNLENTSVEDKSYPEIVEKFNSRILSMLSRFGKQSGRKDEKVLSTHTKSNHQKFDIDNIADRFGFSISETKDILQLFESCFDSKGSFIRTEFESRIPQFIEYEKSIFEFLWGFLDEPLQRNDRVAFLNALYLLASRMENPQKVLAFILDELLKEPLKIFYSDRNAFILASLLLRKYNKEFSVDIEQTPGEVLLVRNGMDEDILRYTLTRVDSDRQLMQDKLNLIHNRLVKALDENNPGAVSWDPHFLISLEREAFIFISLVSGDCARQILIAALSEYGNPESKLYQHNSRDKFMSLLLQQLKLIIRGVGRVGEIDDLELLADLKKNEHKFVEMIDSSLHEKNVAQVFRMIDSAMGNITSLQ